MKKGVCTVHAFVSGSVCSVQLKEYIKEAAKKMHLSANFFRTCSSQGFVHMD